MRALTLLAICAAVAGATAAKAQDVDWQKVDAAIGRGAAAKGTNNCAALDKTASVHELKPSAQLSDRHLVV